MTTTNRIAAVLAKASPPRRTVAQILGAAKVTQPAPDALSLASRIDAMTVRSTGKIDCLARCKHCGTIANLKKQPEIHMGAVGCEKCGKPVTQADLMHRNTRTIQATDLATRIATLAVKATQNPVTEAQPVKVEYGCLMAIAPEALRRRVVRWTQAAVPDTALDPKHGREHESHVTVFYGFHEGFNDFDKLAGLRLNGDSAIEFELGAVTRFECPEYDVIKVDITSPEAERWNRRIGEEFAEQVTPSKHQYHPHLTLAYVQKGQCRELDGSTVFQGKRFSVKKLVYSETERKGRTTVYLSDTPAITATDHSHQPSDKRTAQAAAADQGRREADETRAHDLARDRAEAIYMAAALAAALRLKDEKKKKKREEAILIALILAAEEAYATTYAALNKAVTSTPGAGAQPAPLAAPSDAQIQDEAVSFATKRTPLLRDYATRLEDRLKTAQQEAETEGDDEIAVARKLKKVATEESGTMAATEAQATYGASQNALLKRAGFKTKAWISMDDDRVRPTHVDCDAQGPIPIDATFSNGLLYPGDPAGPIEETANCRCNLVGVAR